ncbi:hypothetical protein GIB67_042522, partial [Kingdonia uniflora]
MKFFKEVNEQFDKENRIQEIILLDVQVWDFTKYLQLYLKRRRVLFVPPTLNKNTYGLKEIDEDLKQAKLERHLVDVLRLNLLKIMLSFLLSNKGRNVEGMYVDLHEVSRMHDFVHLFPKLQGWRMTSFRRHQIVTFKKFFINPDLLVIAMTTSETDMQQELVQEVMRNHIEAPAIGAVPAIEPLAVDTPGIGSSSLATEIGAVVVKLCSQLEGHGKILQKLEASVDQTPAVSVEEQTMEVVKTKVVIFHQEEDVDEASQASTDQTTVISVEEQTMEVTKIVVVIFYQEEDVDEASQITYHFFI